MPTVCHSPSPSSPDTGPGLTPAGTRLVRRCAELGIAVDLSHLNEAGFWDVARLDAGPLIVSHAGVHALSACSRNLTDAQIDAVGKSGGLVGIVFACYFLRPDFANEPETTPLELIVEHVRYVADRVGVEHVAFGSDFDGATIPAALGDVSGYPKLLAALADAGFTTAEIRTDRLGQLAARARRLVAIGRGRPADGHRCRTLLHPSRANGASVASFTGTSPSASSIAESTSADSVMPEADALA